MRGGGAPVSEQRDTQHRVSSGTRFWDQTFNPVQARRGGSGREPRDVNEMQYSGG